MAHLARTICAAWLLAARVHSASALLRGSMDQQAGEAIPDFDTFVSHHRRTYSKESTEYALRKSIYEQRLDKIRRHNAQPARLWTAGINHMSDHTDDEFRARLGWIHHRPSHGAAALLEVGEVIRHSNFIHPAEFSWTNLSMATDVPDQGACGSCWATASAVLLSAHYEITHKVPRTFSVQELVNCVENPLSCGGTGGCSGATVELALDWVVHNGLQTESDVPYEASAMQCKGHPRFRATAAEHGTLDKDGRLLEFPPVSTQAVLATAGNTNQGGQALSLRSFRTLPTNQYEPLIKALVEEGPVGVTVAAGDWSLYSSGVFDGCKDPTLNHAVLLMGIGKAAGQKTWLVRNSWGESWGEHGYIRLLRTDSEETNCAVDTSPKDGVACEGGPAKVTACGTCGILYDNVVPGFERDSKAISISSDGRVE